MLSPPLANRAGHRVGERVGAFFDLAVAAGSGREIDGRRAAPDQRRAGDVGVYVAGIPTLGGRRDVGVDSRLVGQDDVEDLALAGIVRPEQVARADLDANHALRRDS